MKALVSIINYQDFKIPLLKRVVEEYLNNKSIEATVEVYTHHSKAIGIDRCAVKYEPNLGNWAFSWVAHQSMMDRLGDFDLFILSDDDILVTPENIDVFLKHCEIVPDGFIPGLLVAEDFDGKRFTLNMHTSFSPAITGYHIFSGHKYISPSNVHGAMFIALRRHLAFLIDNESFTSFPRDAKRLGNAEISRSLIYRSALYNPNGLIKVIPCDDLDASCVYHLSENYASRGGYYCLDTIKEMIASQLYDLS